MRSVQRIYHRSKALIPINIRNCRKPFAQLKLSNKQLHLRPLQVFYLTNVKHALTTHVIKHIHVKPYITQTLQC